MSDFQSASTNDPYRSPTTASEKKGAVGILTPEEKNWAMIAHLCPLLGFIVPIPFANIIAPAVVWILKREEMPVIDDQAKEAMNFQITLFLMAIVCFILVFFVIGIVLFGLLVVYGVVMAILAAKSVQEGRLYRYPFTLRLI